MKHRTYTLLIAALTLALAGAVGGCGDDTGDTSTGLNTLALSTESVPALDDLVTRLDLTPEQRSRMETALAQLGEVTQERRQSRGQHRRGDGPMGGPPGPRPFMGFLEECSSFLDQGQFVTLVNEIADRREERRETRLQNREGGKAGFQKGMGEGPHRGMGGGPGRGGPDDGLNELGLTETQRTELQAARKAHREAMRMLHDQLRDGTLTEEQFQTQADALRQAMDATLAEILTPEQLEAMQAHRTERWAERAERQLGRLEERQQDLTGFLTQVLQLNDAQQAELSTLAGTVRTRMETMLNGMKDGSVTPMKAMAEGRRVREEFDASFVATLDTDQLQRWEALQRLLPQGPRRGF